MWIAICCLYRPIGPQGTFGASCLHPPIFAFMAVHVCISMYSCMYMRMYPEVYMYTGICKLIL